MGIFKPIRAALLFGLFSCIFFIPAMAQSYLLSNLPIENELSSKQITSIFQDSRGFIWIGTGDGLNFYNANSIKIFKHDVKNKNSLLNNYVQNLCEDKKGNIWIASATGVDCYDPATGLFVHYREDDRKNMFGYKPAVFSDRKGTIWIGCEGLFRLDQKSGQFKKINIPGGGTLGPKFTNRVSGFFQDRTGHYWVSTFDGLFLYNESQSSFTRFDTPPNDENYKRFGILFSSVVENNNGDLHVGTWGYGVFRISIEQKKLIPIQGKGVILTYASQQINGDDIFWYSSNGLVKFSDKNNSSSTVTHQNDDPFSARNDAISVLFTDRQNQLWIGYEKEGIQILSPANQLIKTYPILSERHKISSVGVIAMKDDFIYVGGWYSNALCKLDKNFKPVQWWDHLPAEKNKSSTNVGDIYFDREKNTWLATANGLIFINDKTGAIKNFRHDSAVSKRSFFLKILPEGDSVLWLSGYDNGLSRFSLNTHKLELFGGEPLPFLWKAIFDKNGTVWCANNNGFLEKFDRAEKKFTAFQFDSLTERSIFFDLAYDSSSNSIWITTSNGLVQAELASMHTRIFTEKDGLPTSKINLLTLYRDRLWIGTDHGLSVYDPRKKFFRNFYGNNGLSTEKLDHSLAVGGDGKLYIGADNGFMVMDIASLDEKIEVSPVYITNILENGNPLHTFMKNSPDHISLNHYQNNLSFEFAITDFINSEDNQLFYKLEGWDKDFILTKKGEASYNNLPPGTYTFRVKGINHNGVRNEKGDEVMIVILPPFWKTVWFIVIISLILVSSFFLVTRYISQRNLKEKLLRLEKEQALDKERNRISGDMHDDLGSGLTKIAILSEVAKKQLNEPEKARQQLENISASSRELVDNLQDIIWVLNPKNDTLESLASYIREYSLKFFEPFGTDIQFNYPERFTPVTLSEETRRTVFLVVKESLNNIAKHAWCYRVTLTLLPAQNQITLLINDDGRGFDPGKTRQFGNGLVNMKNRVTQIGGTFVIDTQAGKGTETKITIPV